MLKFLLCAAILVLCTACAFLFTRKYRMRKDFYYNFLLFNTRLANEVSYTRIPLPSFLEKYRFDGDFARMLEKKKKSDFAEGTDMFSYLNQDENKFLGDYFRMIGRSDAASQKAYLLSVRQELEDKKKKCEEQYSSYFSLFLKLGFLAGLILVILIV